MTRRGGPGWHGGRGDTNLTSLEIHKLLCSMRRQDIKASGHPMRPQLGAIQGRPPPQGLRAFQVPCPPSRPLPRGRRPGGGSAENSAGAGARPAGAPTARPERELRQRVARPPARPLPGPARPFHLGTGLAFAEHHRLQRIRLPSRDSPQSSVRMGSTVTDAK